MPSRPAPRTRRPRVRRRAHRTRPLAAALVLAALALAPAVRTAAAENEVDDEYRAAVTRLLELQRTPESVSQQLTYSVAQQTLGSLAASGIAITEPLQRVVFEVSKSSFGDRFDEAETLSRLYVPIYAELYSQEELDQLIAFWESPVGVKTIEHMPEMTQRSYLVLEEASQPYIDEFQETVDARLAEEGIALVPQAALAPTLMPEATPTPEASPESSTEP
jgi:hypothetical protein